MFEKPKLTRRALSLTTAVCAAVLVMAASAWACTNHNGSVWLCPTSTACSSLTTQSYTHGTTVYSNAGSLAGGTIFELRYAHADQSTAACHTGTLWGTFTADSGGNWTGKAVVMPAASASVYSECAVPTGTNTDYSSHVNFTST